MKLNKKLGIPEPNSDIVNSEPKVLLCGYGWVGQYMGKYFKTADYVTTKDIVRKVKDDKPSNSVISNGYYDLAIISVPTPMNQESGQCDTSIVEEVVHKWRDYCNYFLIKSTVEIGTTDRIAKEYGVKIAMSPEYIGETLGHPLVEVRRDTFQIIGGDEETASKIAEFFRLVLHASAPIMIVTAKEAEIIKYAENMWIMQRVDYWNDVYEICQTLGGNYNRVREGLVLDPRFSRTHSFVYPHNRGWSGKCLSKDMPGLAYVMRENGHPLTTLEHQIIKNAKYVRSIYKNKERLYPEDPIWRKPQTIELSQGHKTIVDYEDYQWLNQWKWYYAHGYAVRNIYDENGKPHQVRMHRLIIDTPGRLDTDHINENKLDNRRFNLRVATRSQNIANQFVGKQNNSGYKGVSWKDKNKKWVAQIRVNNKVIHIGLFDSKEEAGLAYNREAFKYFGEFAFLNKI